MASGQLGILRFSGLTGLLIDYFTTQVVYYVIYVNYIGSLFCVLL